ncbi:MAG: S8 family peptidase [Acidimicrobiales bacterium]
MPGLGGVATAAAAEEPDRYIVVLKDGVDTGRAADEQRRALDVEVRQVYRSALNGYAARIPADRVARLRADPRVAYVEADAPVKATAQTLPWGIDRVNADVSSTVAGNGSGSVGTVSAYVIDTGINFGHSDLNVVAHGNMTGDGRNYDCNGHGTHVAGTIGAKDNANHVVGAAPGLPIIGLKVLDCAGNGSMSSVIAAVDWVTAAARKPAVANLSLSGAGSQALDDAVRRSAASGVLYVVAAGNDGANACNYSPARAGGGVANGIVTVAATDASNREPSWSNYGSCVDVWAPGVGVVSTWNNGGTATMSGTSMASPHVAGSGALYLSRNASASPAAAEGILKAYAASPPTASKDGRSIKIVYAGWF